MPFRTLRPGKDKPRLTTEQKRAARRVSELSRIYWHQYPHGLPHNGLGVKYCRYMCRTMAFLPDDRRKKWLEQHADWMNAPTRDYILSLGPHWYYPRPLGQYLELYDEDREKLEAWSVEAIDVTEKERRMINKEKHRQAQGRRRRKNGAKPQSQSERRTRPWEALKISESTYYRRKKRDSISSRPSLTISKSDEVLSPAPSEPHATAVAGADIIHLFPRIKHPTPSSRAREDVPLLRMAA
jgi:hypothetical protein